MGVFVHLQVKFFLNCHHFKALNNFIGYSQGGYGGGPMRSAGAGAGGGYRTAPYGTGMGGNGFQGGNRGSGGGYRGGM